MIAERFSRILVPTDMSIFARLALRWARLFHTRLGSRVTLLHAHEAFYPYGALEGLPFVARNWGEIRGQLRKSLGSHAAEFLPDVPVDLRVVDEDPAQAIVHAASSLDAGLIIMGTHGRTGLRRALLGSVTEQVLRDTSCPVLTVSPDHSPEDRISVRSILCPVNFTSVARESLNVACELARVLEAHLVVAHVLEQAIDTRAQFDAWVDPIVGGRCRYSRVILQGNVAARVLETADSTGADLVVLGSTHRRFRDEAVVGSTTERVVRYARLPVLTIVPTPAMTAEEKVEEELIYA
jgi:nucleotide-binding universal stress UspA family protein